MKDKAFFKLVYNLTSILKFGKTKHKSIPCEGEGKGEVAVFSAEHWDCRSSKALIESATPCHDAQVVRPYRVSNPLRLTVLASKSEDYTTAPQHLLKTGGKRSYRALHVPMALKMTLNTF